MCKRNPFSLGIFSANVPSSAITLHPVPLALAVFPGGPCDCSASLPALSVTCRQEPERPVVAAARRQLLLPACIPPDKTLKRLPLALPWKVVGVRFSVRPPQQRPFSTQASCVDVKKCIPPQKARVCGNTQLRY